MAIPLMAIPLIHAIVLAATTDAARQVVLNGGRILSSDGQYIDGIFERQWYPVLQGLKSYVDSPGVAYSDIMQDFLPDTNDALRTRNARLLQFLSKLSADLYEKQLPYIHNVKLRALYVQGITGNRQLAQQLKCGQVNLSQLNNYIAQAYNGFIDFLNSQPQ